MGGWAFIEPRLRAMGYNVQYVGRDASASPATGSHHVHDHEQHELVETALTGSVPHQVRSVPASMLKRPRGDGQESDAKRPALSPSS
jgi:2-oxoglutarate dehydrogenase E1 component